MASSEPLIAATGVLLGSYDPFENIRETVTSSSSRDSHIVCGICCDTRKAVLIMNSITIVFHFIMMIGVFVGFSFLNNNTGTIVNGMDDDFAKSAFEEWAENGNFTAIEVVVVLLLIGSMTMHGCGIWGAYKFEAWGVIVAAVAYGISVLLGLISLNIVHILLSGFFLYPHIVLIKEMQEGTTSEDNYESVCCGRDV